MPVLLDHDAGRASTLVRALPEDTTTVATLDQLEGWLRAHAEEHVVVLGVEVSLVDAGEVATRLLGTHPSAGVVLVRRSLDTAVFTAAMHAGIPAVVAEDDQDGLRAAVERARQTWEAIHGPAGAPTGAAGRVVTVFSPKGGVGKTTLAVNLAVALAGEGTRVCLIDLDLAFGDVAITLQLIPDHTIEEAAGAGTGVDYTLLHQLLTPHSENLMVLAAPTVPDARDRIPAALVRQIIATVRQHFDYVVVDTSPGFDDEILQALDETDELVLVATLDVPTVKNMKMALETLDLLGMTKQTRHLVLNRADDEVGLSPHNVEGILTLPVAVAIPSDMAVANATNHGRPIALAQPGHRVSRAIRTLAAAVAGTSAAAAVHGRRRGLFGRRGKGER